MNRTLCESVNGFCLGVGHNIIPLWLNRQNLPKLYPTTASINYPKVSTDSRTRNGTFAESIFRQASKISTSVDGHRYNVVCGQIDLGNVATDMTARMKKGVPQPDGSMAVEPTMDVDNVSRMIVYMARLPLDANVQFVTVMATQMPFIGRG